MGAWIEEDCLVVLVPRLDRLRVPLSELAKQLGTNKDISQYLAELAKRLGRMGTTRSE